MRTLLNIVRIACLIAGICGALLAAWVFIDPDAFAQAYQGSWLAPPSVRWRAAFLFLFSLLMIGFGTGWLRHRTLP